LSVANFPEIIRKLIITEMPLSSQISGWFPENLLLRRSAHLKLLFVSILQKSYLHVEREREREREREELTVRNNTRGEGQRTNLNFLPTRITLTVKTNNWSIGGLACSLPTFYHCTHSSCTHTPPLSPTYKIIITDPNHANQNQITTKKKSETFKGT
jgi:hypothetical protein